MSSDPTAQPSEDQMRAAYEAELSRITSADMILQTAVSLLNLGGRRLGLAPGSEAERDLAQVRDAVDGVSALLGILERSAPAQELRPLRDALSQLQMAYAREAQAGTATTGAGEGTEPSAQSAGARESAPAADRGTGAPATDGGPGAPAAGSRPAAPAAGAGKPAGKPGAPPAEEKPGAGPAESSGRLWVPGR